MSKFLSHIKNGMLLAVCMVFTLAFAVPVFAGTNIASYVIFDSTTQTITKYNRTDIAEIEIPSKISGTAVKAIGDEAFKDHTEITSVEFPNTLETIGHGAFKGVSFGTQNVYGSLTIPSSVNKIGYEAFAYSPYLKEVTFENYTGVGDPAAITFTTNGVLSNPGPFGECPQLLSITLSNQCQNLSYRFAYNSAKLKTVAWPNELKTIGTEAFRGDTALETGNLSNTALTSIGISAFNNCSALHNVAFPGTLVTISEAAFANAGMGTKTRTESLTIPESVATIGYEAFAYSPYLKEVTFENYTGVGDPAAITFTTNGALSNPGPFGECPQLLSITLSNQCQNLSYRFAYNSAKLKTVAWPNELKTIGTEAFRGDTALETGNLSNTALTSIGISAFNNCSALHNVAFPGTLVTISEAAFANAGMGTNTRTESLTIPESVATIGYEAFAYSPYLKEVTFENYTGVGDPAAITFTTNGVLSNPGPFGECPQLLSITLSNQCQNLSYRFAYNSAKLKTVAWPNELKTIGTEAFRGDTALETGNLSNTALTSIGISAFNNCSALHNVSFPDTLVTIGDSAFNGAGLGTSSEYGELIIPSNVETIGAYAFAKCLYLEKVEFGPDNGYVNPMSLGSGLFKNCGHLLKITLSERITTIPDSFASECTELAHVVIPNSVTSIGQNAFYLSKLNFSSELYDIIVDSSNSVVSNYDWAGDNRKLSDSVVVSITLNKSETELEVGDRETLTATVKMYPENAAKPDVTWSSDNSNVVTVDNGLIEAKITGSTNIKASTSRGNRSASCAVTVVEEGSLTNCTVTFDSRGGSAVESQTVGRGATASRPTDPTRSGYTFAGWFTDASCTTSFDFSTPITSGITLYAKWNSEGGGEDTDGFVLGINNNNWSHSNGARGGFAGKTNYKFNSEEYYKALIKDEESYVSSSVRKYMTNSWGGSCYGIASTMGLLYEGIHSIGQYSSSGASDYFHLDKPVNDNKFMDAITYYQVSQLVRYIKSHGTYTNGIGGGESLSDFLRNLCEATKDNNVVLLAYSGGDMQGGHAILAVNSEDNSDGSHLVKLYDMNSYNSNGGEFISMSISSDYGSFRFEDGNGNIINETNYKRLEYGDWSRMKLFSDYMTDSSEISESVVSMADGHAIISIKNDTKITNAEGKSISYESGQLSGNMIVYDVNSIDADDLSRIDLEVDDSDYFVLEGNSQDVSVGSSRGYMSVEGSGFDGVTLSYDDGVKMDGTDYTFKVFVQTDNVIEGNEKGLASIEGRSTGESTITRDGNNVRAVTNGSFSDIVTTNYVGINTAEERISGDVTEVSVDTTRSTDGNDPDDNGGGNNSGNGSNESAITVSDNKPMDYVVETRDSYKIGYCSSVPFWGKSKPSPEYFGKITVSVNDVTYEATKIKINKKKKLIQIIGLNGADKATVKAVKKATKGNSGLSFNVNPYYVKYTDDVTVKKKKSGAISSVKISINGKDYKAKKNEWSANDSGLITFTGENLNGSYQSK